MSIVSGMKMPRADKDNVMLYKINIPDLEAQRKLLKEFESMEREYLENQNIIDNYKDNKNVELTRMLELKETTL